MTTSVQGAGQPKVPQQDKPQSTGIQIKQELQGTQLASVFNAALMSATNQGSRTISIWDTKEKGGDGDGELSEAEMRAAIEAIQEENKKTESADKYKGRADKNVDNTDAEKNAFYELNNAMNYNWNGKWDTKNNQFKERQKQIENNERDVEKSMRVMLAGINVDDLKAEKETDEAKNERKTTFGQTVSSHVTGKDGENEKKLPEVVQKTLNDNYADKRIEGTPITDKDGVTTINFKDGTSVKIAKDGKTITETDRADTTTTVYEDTVENNNSFERKTTYNPSNNMFLSRTVYTPKQGETEATETTYKRDKNGVVSKKTGNTTNPMTQQAFALDENTDKEKIKVKNSDEAKTKLQGAFNGIDLSDVGTITEYRTKLDGSCVIYTKEGKKHYICKDSNEENAPWKLHTYEPTNT